MPANDSTSESRTVNTMRKLLVLLVVAFVLFYLFTQPHNAAQAVRTSANALVDAFNSIIAFISALFA
jgi:hypothetical protein